MVQQEGKAQTSVLLDSNEKEGGLRAEWPLGRSPPPLQGGAAAPSLSAFGPQALGPLCPPPQCLRVEKQEWPPLSLPARVCSSAVGATQVRIGQYPLRQVPMGAVNAEAGQLLGWIWVHFPVRFGFI